MAKIFDISDFSAPELDVYARLTENQLVNRADPANALFIAESPLVIGRALDAAQPLFDFNSLLFLKRLATFQNNNKMPIFRTREHILKRHYTIEE